MKNVITILLATLSISSFAFAQDDIRVVHILDLTEKDLMEASQGFYPNLAVEFSKGTKISLRFCLSGNLLNLVDENKDVGEVQIKQTFYLRFIDEELIMSFDLIDWKPFFEYLSGSASIGLEVDDETRALLFNSEINLFDSDETPY